MANEKITTRSIILSILLCSFFFSAVEAKAQPASSDISKKIAAKAIEKGDVLVHTEKGKYKLFASYDKKKLTGMYATSTDGKNLEVTYKRSQQGSSVICIVCVLVNAIPTCHRISCDEVPGPKSNIAQ